MIWKQTIIGVKSRWEMYSGPLKRRMWLLTAIRLKYTLKRFQGEKLLVELWTRKPWKRIIEPPGPWGLTIQPSLSPSWRINWLSIVEGSLLWSNHVQPWALYAFGFPEKTLWGHWTGWHHPEKSQRSLPVVQASCRHWSRCHSLDAIAKHHLQMPFFH